MNMFFVLMKVIKYIGRNCNLQ